MARLRVDLFSNVLGLSTSLTVILPEATTEQIGMTGRTREGDPPVLYLLHGLSDDDTTWTRRTSIERYVAPLGLAVVMPQVHRSFYADQVHGLRYWTYLSEELPALVGRFFRVSQAREDTFVAGLSMGGYAALKWALRRPDRIAAAASLSGSLDLAGRERTGEWGDIADPCWGDTDLRATGDDVPWLLDRAVASERPLPALYLCCGTEDRLIGENRAFVRAAEGRVASITADFGPGEHDWAYWDRTIQDVLAWLPLRGASAATAAHASA
jgi:S-formylglutathione hydrolase FrmB